jgi:hypothetical protein
MSIKKIIFKLALIIFVACVGYVSYINHCSKKAKVQALQPNRTTLYVVNGTSDSVLVCLTLGADTSDVNSVSGIFGITQTGLQGCFTLAPNDTVYYQSIGKGFDGNLSFGGLPNNCPDTTLFPFGMNIFEFNLNDNAYTPNGQETLDNSCVAGVNCKIICNMSDTNWNDGDSTGIQKFENSYLYSNTYRIGVFPYGCDSCTVSVAPPDCPNHKKYAQPQKKNICNIQRNATLSGGSVYVVYAGVLNGEVLK